MDKSAWNEPFLSNAEWTALIENDRYTAWPMPLACDIKLTQTLSYSGAVYRARGEAAICYNVDTLISEILEQTLGMVDSTWPANHGHVFVVCLGNQPDKIGCFSLSEIMARRATPVKWHEVRLCLDPMGYVHWFDANVGWFRSQRPKPEIACLKRDLSQIFNILQYPEKYSVVSAFKIHAKKNEKIRYVDCRHFLGPPILSGD